MPPSDPPPPRRSAEYAARSVAAAAAATDFSSPFLLSSLCCSSPFFHSVADTHYRLQGADLMQFRDFRGAHSFSSKRNGEHEIHDVYVTISILVTLFREPKVVRVKHMNESKRDIITLGRRRWHLPHRAHAVRFRSIRRRRRSSFPL